MTVKSVWQRPDPATRTTTWPGPAWGSGTSWNSGCFWASRSRYASIVSLLRNVWEGRLSDERFLPRCARRRSRHGGRRGNCFLFEHVSREDLLSGDGALRPAVAEKGNGPVCQHREAVLEAGQREQMHREPHQPCEEPR